MSLSRRLFALMVLAGVSSAAFGQAPPADLANYVKQPDPTFSWKLVGKTEADAGVVYDIDLISQTWHDIKWDHKLQVMVPKGAKPQATMLLWNQGGTPNPTSGLLGLTLASKVNAPVAFLYGVPKQPLYDGKREDALIAETFARFLETKDSSWPLLFPMVKSVVKAMDALQAFAKEEWKFEVKQFVVTGASKRGWTSWLTAASGDPRVKAIAPLVIDTLNFPIQMNNQVAAFGKPSEMIKDYTERKLVPIPDTTDARKLWQMVDPWVYRDKLTLPKMLIHGTNDPYWPQDALNSYWDDLKGEKHVLYVPNAGHDLREADKAGTKELFPTRAVNTLGAFAKCQIFDLPMPKMAWKYTPRADGGVDLDVGSETAPKVQRMWTANAETRDFRQSRWTPQAIEPLPKKGDGKTPNTVVTFVPPATGFRAVMVETEYDLGGLALPLTTQIRILEAKK